MKRPEDLELEGEMNIFQRPRTALIPMFTGSLSAFGSYLVIRELWSDAFRPAQTAPRSSMRAPLVRALLAISITDFLASIAFGLSTIPTPHWQTHVPYAAGNFTTCNAQGFFFQFVNVSSPMYITMLTFFYLVIIKYQWTDAHIRRIEIWSHTVILTVALVCSIVPLPLKLYNNPYHCCWISSYPEGCEILKPDVPCERGHDWVFWITIFTIFPLWPALLAVSIMMCMVRGAVRKMEGTVAKQTWGNTKSSLIQEENKSDEFQRKDEYIQRKNEVFPNEPRAEDEEGSVSESNDSPPPADAGDANNNNNNNTQLSKTAVNRKRSRAISRQATLFVLAFILVHALRLIVTVWFAVAEDGNAALYVMALDVMLPLQGWFNALVLLRTRKLRTPEGRMLQAAMNYASNLAATLWRRASSSVSSRGMLGSPERQSPSQQEMNGEPTDGEAAHTAVTAEEKSGVVDNSSSSSMPQVAGDSLDLYNSPTTQWPAATFRFTNLDSVSSADPDSSIAKRERRAAAKLDDKVTQSGTSGTIVRGLYSEDPPMSPLGRAGEVATRKEVTFATTHSKSYSKENNDEPSNDSASNRTQFELGPQFKLTSPLRSSARFVSDITEDIHDGSTFETLVDDSYLPSKSSKGRPLYESSVVVEEDDVGSDDNGPGSRRETFETRKPPSNGIRLPPAPPLYNDDE